MEKFPPSERPTIKAPPPNPFENHERTFTVSAVSIPKSEESVNQDALFEHDDQDGNGGTFLVADGMGGYAGGEIASSVVRDTVAKENWRFELIQRDRLAGKDVGPGLTAELREMRLILKMANTALLEKRKTLGKKYADMKKYASMGTVGTLVRLVGMKDKRMEAVIGHVGDTRASVQYPDGRLETLTLDAHLVLKLLAKRMGLEVALRAQSILDELHSDDQYEGLLGLVDHPKLWPSDVKIRPEDILFLKQTLGLGSIGYYFETRNGVAEFFGKDEPGFRIFHALVPDGSKLIITSDGCEGLYTSEMQAIAAGAEEKEVDDLVVVSAAQSGKTPAERLAFAAEARAEEGPMLHRRSKGHDDISVIVVEIPKR